MIATRFRFIFLTVLCALAFSSCASAPLVTTAGEDAGLLLPTTVPASSSSTVSTEEEPAPTEEEQTQIDQMNKDQVSKTYSYLKQEFEDGRYYLSYTEERLDDPSYGKKEFLLASDGNAILIRDLSLRYSYLIQGDTLTVMNDREKTLQSFSLEGTRFSYENYLNWHHWSSYEMVEFTSLRSGTQKRPKLTETFTTNQGDVSFYYYRDSLSTVSGTDASRGEWIHTIHSLHSNPKQDLFELPSNYTRK